MADQAYAKQVLQELVKQDGLGNKVCNDCPNPNPQWASLSFAVFICLECAGQHRGYGVHISFVRSISMDTWQGEQIKRMQIGGNIPFKEFMQSYPLAEQGGYQEGFSAYDKYHCWAATQYREKLDSVLANKEWSPSPAPTGLNSPTVGFTLPGRPSSAQVLRKSRTSVRSATGSTLRGNSSSPVPFGISPHGTPDILNDQKSANESYFATLGQTNATRPANLPPSQGGRYQGFGSSLTPLAPSQHPSYSLSSAAAPSFSNIQENPVAALSKGWSLFSAAVVGASRVVSENVIQPGMEKVKDPALQASVAGYLSEVQKRATEVGSTANSWSKKQFGVDVADTVGGVVGTVKGKITGGPARSGYESLAQDHDRETASLYHGEDDHFFGEYRQGGLASPNPPSLSQSICAGSSKSAPAAKKNDWDDEWNDF